MYVKLIIIETHDNGWTKIGVKLNWYFSIYIVKNIKLGINLTNFSMVLFPVGYEICFTEQERLIWKILTSAYFIINKMKFLYLLRKIPIQK